MKMRQDTKTKIAGGSPSRRGFALLITVTLLAFLVLLLVSLASLTRVETQVASNNQKLTQARQNAVLALNIAVGQLQKYAGPDNRVTGQAGLIGADASLNPYLTGVWDANAANVSDKPPLMWLVSGSEKQGATAASVYGAVPDPSGTVTTSDVFLVDTSVAVGSSATADEKKRRIRIAKQAITAPAGSIPGMTTAATVGNYAYWVGDQGVKASIGMPDLSSRVTYGPWSTHTEPARLRQQLGSTANYFKNGSDKYGFDPFYDTNPTYFSSIFSPTQFSFLKSFDSVPASYSRKNFHDLTVASYSVLANTLPSSDAARGLMKDLSAKPELLGDAFKRQVDFTNTGFMSTPAATDIRRYYQITAPKTGAPADSTLPSFVSGSAPVLSEFLLRFRVSRVADDKVTVQSRLYVSFWNPYTTSLIPSDLTLEITGLPVVTLEDKQATSLQIPAENLDLQGAYNLPSAVRDSSGAMKVILRFDPSATGGSTADKTNWLPGRSYSWSTHKTIVSNVLQFYNKDSDTAGAWTYESVPQLVGGKVNQGIKVSTSAVTQNLIIVVKNSAGEVLSTCHAPDFPILNAGTNSDGWKFAFAFRLNQPVNNDTSRPWPETGYDFRAADIPKSAYIGFTAAGGFNPDSYSSTVTTDYPQFLLSRSTTVTPNNDAPLFELPRQPLLSMGELQHIPLALEGASLFSIGNSWGGDVGSSHLNANTVFDRFFFSGLTAGSWGPDFDQGQPLPNWNMRPVEVSNLADLRSKGELSAGNLLQGGGFNLNSTSVPAWRAVLSRTRFNTTTPFKRATLSNSTGTQVGAATTSMLYDADTTLGSGLAAPVFMRFPQSAQEVFSWQAVAGRFSTQAFRQGIRGQTSLVTDDDPDSLRTLTTDQIETLANRIVDLIKAKGASTGPFRTLSQFLNPSSAYVINGKNRSLIEKAIEDSGINPTRVRMGDVADPTFPGFSSLTLTQADIMVALAPYLRTRSDTFVVRTYGDAVNPVTSAIEGRAYAEAIVQRMPTPVDPSGAIDQPTGFGRRFKIVSFRWLTPSDI